MDLLQVVVAHIEVVRCAKALLRAFTISSVSDDGRLISTAHAALVVALKQLEGSDVYRITPDLLGKPTIWCNECDRDSGFHTEVCSHWLASLPNQGEKK